MKQRTKTQYPEIPIHTDHLEYPESQLLHRNGRDRKLLKTFVMRASEDFIRVLYKDFICNGASTPRLAWWFQSPWTGRGVPGFWGHDADYSCKRGWKLARDWEMLKIHKRYGVKFFRRWMVFLIVAIFGWPAWWKSDGDCQYVEYFHVEDFDRQSVILKKEF